MQGPHSLGFIGTGVMGEPGGGQVVKILNNMVLFQTVLEEARAAGYGGDYYPVIAKVVDR